VKCEGSVASSAEAEDGSAIAANAAKTRVDILVANPVRFIGASCIRELQRRPVGAEIKLRVVNTH
jgi:hypothetical protein